MSLVTVGQYRRVLEPGPDAVAVADCALVDRPRCDAVAVVNLLEGYAGLTESALDGCGMRDRVGGVGVERLHHGSDASG